MEVSWWHVGHGLESRNSLIAYYSSWRPCTLSSLTFLERGAFGTGILVVSCSIHKDDIRLKEIFDEGNGEF